MKIHFLTPLCLAEKDITEHFMCRMSFSLTINRDPEISVSVKVTRMVPLQNQNSNQSCVLLSDPATPGTEVPRLQEFTPSPTGRC